MGMLMSAHRVLFVPTSAPVRGPERGVSSNSPIMGPKVPEPPKTARSLFDNPEALSMEDPTPPLDTPKVVGGLKVRL